MRAPLAEGTPLVPAKEATEKAAADRLAPIEGVRTLYTVGIIFYHLVQMTNVLRVAEAFRHNETVSSAPPFETWFERATVRVGDVGVAVFTIVAGFLSQLSDRPPTTGMVGRLRFVLARFARLAPAYYASIAAIALASIFNSMANLRSNNPLVVLLELLMVHAWTWTSSGSLNGPDWFVSALFGCIAVHALLGEWLYQPITNGPIRALAAALCLRARAATIIYVRADRPLYLYELGRGCFEPKKVIAKRKKRCWPSPPSACPQRPPLRTNSTRKATRRPLSRCAARFSRGMPPCCQQSRAPRCRASRCPTPA